jgi:hypothetical protein
MGAQISYYLKKIKTTLILRKINRITSSYLLFYQQINIFYFDFCAQILFDQIHENGYIKLFFIWCLWSVKNMRPNRTTIVVLYLILKLFLVLNKLGVRDKIKIEILVPYWTTWQLFVICTSCLNYKIIFCPPKSFLRILVLRTKTKRFEHIEINLQQKKIQELKTKNRKLTETKIMIKPWMYEEDEEEWKEE